MKIDVLLDLARQRSNLASDSALARRLGKNHAFVFTLRKGHALPSDESLVMLCTLAKEDPLPWLLTLNIERTTGEARRIYSALAQDLVGHSPTRPKSIVNSAAE